ncbi:MAG: hypothetical protein NTY87_03445 [Planctomycetia bacterium]|nr:hypothetical protein [Planctomycetia bacterium]
MNAFSLANPPKSLDLKLARIMADPGCRDFIVADAKDADMAFGLAAPGVPVGGNKTSRPFRSIDEYRDSIREIVQQGLVDVMLMSASTSEILTLDEGLFAGTAVTPAVRMNDTTDIWLATGNAQYSRQPARPFSTTTISQAQVGRVAGNCGPRSDIAATRSPDLGLFSVTFNNDATLDRDMLLAYREFRIEAERVGFRHFLEVFLPNAIGQTSSGRDQRRASDVGDNPESMCRFLADSVVRMLAGVPRSGRPLFLKVPYLGPALTEQLAAYDRSVVVGILGGSAGTTHDAFDLVEQAKRYGARIALFGRKINAAEHQLTFVKCLRAVADDQLSAVEAVRAYHSELITLGISPNRSLADDLVSTRM